ncbi:MAG: type II toxin-antitoxin system VapC family toxin [Desulfobacteraceae bacterium]|nr:type II toxin-antitoxin system VapC family toxin [Desulfobacteraceae bacterium]
MRESLQSAGNIIGAMDMMIAAHARNEGMILVTNNEKHLKRVPKMKIENWTKLRNST